MLRRTAWSLFVVTVCMTILFVKRFRFFFASRRHRRLRRKKIYQSLREKLVDHMAHPARFELTACRLGGDRSILLSYGCISGSESKAV